MGNIISFRRTNEKNVQRKEKSDSMCSILRDIKNKSPMELLEENDISLIPPIDVEKLLDKLGISIVEKNFANIEDILEVERGSILGAAFSNGNDLAIFSKKGDSIHRKKFTLAHELAHCCNDCQNNESDYIEFRRDRQVDMTKCGIEYDEEKERRANVFAGELLMPQKVLQKYYDKMIVPSLTTLAKIFDVSIAVMAARLEYLKWPYFKDDFTNDDEPILYEGK